MLGETRWKNAVNVCRRRSIGDGFGEGLRRLCSCSMIDRHSSIQGAQMYTEFGPSISGPTSLWRLQQNKHLAFEFSAVIAMLLILTHNSQISKA